MTTPNSTQLGTAGGTLLSLFPQLASDDIFRTILLAAVGAVVSFTVSVLLKLFLKRGKD